MSDDIGKIISDTMQLSLQIARRASAGDPKKALSFLKGAIKAQSNELDVLKRRTVEAAVSLGVLLAEARRLVPHGKWGNWVEKNCGFTPRHANRFIQLSVYYQSLEPSNRTFMSDLTVTAAIEMARQKADPAKFDAEDFPAHIAESPPEDVDDETPWTEPPDMQPEPAEKAQPAPALAPPPKATKPKRSATENAWLKQLRSKDEIVEAEFREIETVTKPSATPVSEVDEPSASVQTPSDEMIDARKPLATPKELLRGAYRIIRGLSNGKQPDPAAVVVWVANYDMLTISNKLAADRDNDMEV